MSGRVYNRHDWDKPYFLRIDLRDEKPDVEEIFEYPKRYIAVAVKNQFDQAHYRTACMAGMEHPLSIEQEQYTLTTIHIESFDADVFSHSDDSHGYIYANRFTELEMEFIKTISKRPEVEWAIDNSFDGLYIQKVDDYAHFGMKFTFAVYLKEEQATFWKLKFHGR